MTIEGAYRFAAIKRRYRFTIRYDIHTCAQNLTKKSQLNLAHGSKNGKIRKTKKQNRVTLKKMARVGLISAEAVRGKK